MIGKLASIKGELGIVKEDSKRVKRVKLSEEVLDELGFIIGGQYYKDSFVLGSDFIHKKTRINYIDELQEHYLKETGEQLWMEQ